MLRLVSFTVHHGADPELLLDQLAGLLAQPLADPFARELVLVPARGVERWIMQRLSHTLGASGPDGLDGVCAGVEFASPHSLVARLLGCEDTDPWHPDQLVWTVLDTLDAHAGDAWCAPVAAHLGQLGQLDGVEGPDREHAARRSERRYSVARRIAGLFSSYAAQRPRLLTDWREGRLDSDGQGGGLDPDLSWQPELWRRVLERTDAVPPDARHRQVVERLRSGEESALAGLDLPDRLSVFGHTRMPRADHEVLVALGGLREVHLWLPQASPRLYEELAAQVRSADGADSAGGAAGVAGGPVRRSEDDSWAYARHPLLASLGRDARELVRQLGEAGSATDPGNPDIDNSDSGQRAEPDDLLGWLQSDIRRNETPSEAERRSRRLDPLDRSVQVHACHGASRQIDVLREVLVGLLADDPTLEPRDIVVMCPDIDTYAPLIEAGFGLAEAVDDPHPAHLLRVRLADRGPSSTNPLLALAVRLIEAAEGRARARDLLDLAGEPVVRRRFGFTDEDLDRIAGWVEDAGIRWGTGLEHRRRYGVDLFAHTWQDGLHRLYLGIGMGAEDFAEVRSVLPLDDVGSNDVELIGRFGEFLGRLFAWFDLAVPGRRRSLAEWIEGLSRAVHGLGRTPADEAWTVAQFDREFARILSGAGDAPHDPGAADGPGQEGHALRLADVRRLVSQRMRSRPTRSNFRTGTLTVCTMVPMRSVPHRVVCLVGMDDGMFPRIQGIDGDDVLARGPVTGERDVRSEDRQLLLDAVMAASQTLVITHHGADEQTGEPRPPCAPLGELLDALDLSVDPDTPAVGQAYLRHPLQPHDERNLERGALVPGQPFSFDVDALAGARAAREQRPAPALLTAPLPPNTGDVSLADLRAFLHAPMKRFCTQRLQITLPREADEVRDAIPIDLDALEKWQIGDRLVRQVLDGADQAAVIRSEQLRRALPPSAIGQRTLTEIARRAQPLVAAGLDARADRPSRRIDVTVDLPDGTRLTGVVPDVYGSRIVRVGYSTLGAKQRLSAWVDLLALSAAYPDEHWTAHSLGPKGRNTLVAVCGPVDHTAAELLTRLVDLYRRGMSEPVPLAPRTALAWAEETQRLRRGAAADPLAQAAKRWETDPYDEYPGENAAAEHIRIFGPHAPLEVLLGEPRPDERWSAEETTRLGQYANRLWSPLLDGGEQVRAL